MTKVKIENQNVAESKLGLIKSQTDLADRCRKLEEELLSRIPPLRVQLHEITNERQEFIIDLDRELRFAAKKIGELHFAREILEKRIAILENQARYAHGEFEQAVNQGIFLWFDVLEELRARRRQKIKLEVYENLRVTLTSQEAEMRIERIDDELIPDMSSGKNEGAARVRRFEELKRIFPKLESLILGESAIFENSEWDPADGTQPQPKSVSVSPPLDPFVGVKYVALSHVAFEGGQFPPGTPVDQIPEEALAFYRKNGSIGTVAEYKARPKEPPKPVIGKFQDVGLPHKRFGEY
jgi:hypothetical protein